MALLWIRYGKMNDLGHGGIHLFSESGKGPATGSGRADDMRGRCRIGCVLRLRSWQGVEQDIARLRDAHELFMAAPDIGMRLLGKPPKRGIHLTPFQGAVA